MRVLLVEPLVWIAEKWLRIEREQACDDTVIGYGAENCEYASYLLDLAKSLPSNRRTHARAIAIAHNSELKKRLGHILSRSIKRTRLPRKVGIISAIVVVSGLLPLAAVQLEPRTADLDPQRLNSQPIIQNLIAQLQSEHADVQKRAAWSLGERENRDAVEPLIKALQDDHPEVRAMTAWALGEIKDHRALPPLLTAMEDEDAYAREMVVRAVGELEAGRAMRPILKV